MNNVAIWSCSTSNLHLSTGIITTLITDVIIIMIIIGDLSYSFYSGFIFISPEFLLVMESINKNNLLNDENFNLEKKGPGLLISLISCEPVESNPLVVIVETRVSSSRLVS